jgi:protein involved in polysaccharide export with SLBB domain
MSQIMFSRRMIRNTSKLLVVLVALAAGACSDRDITPIVDDGSTVPGAQQSLAFQTTGARGGGQVGQDADASDYALGSNDRLRITVFGEERLTGEYVLDGGGSLAFPLIGQVSANGMTAKQLEGAIGGKLSPTFVMNPSVSIEVLTRRPVYVVGEVQKPGTYPHSAKMNVLTAIATAGGYTPRGRQDAFYLKRTDKDGRIYRIRATQETQVRPGDVIEVRERYL